MRRPPQARVDAICDQEADAFAGARVARYKGRFGLAFLEDEAHAPLLDATWKLINEDIVPRHLNALVALLRLGGTDWLAGTPEPTIADFCWAPALKALLDGKTTGDPSVLRAFPDLLAFMKSFYALPAVAAYYKGSDETQGALA